MANIQLDWPVNPASELVSSYKVWQGTPGNPLGLVATVATNTVTLDVPTGIYRWAISAVNLAGESVKSAETSSPGAPSAPGAPTVTVL